MFYENIMGRGKGVTVGCDGMPLGWSQLEGAMSLLKRSHQWLGNIRKVLWYMCEYVCMFAC